MKLQAFGCALPQPGHPCSAGRLALLSYYEAYENHLIPAWKASAAMYHILGDKATAVEVEPGLFGIKLVDGDEGARGISLLRGWLKAGARHSPHTHDSEEAVVFLRGCGVLRIGKCEYQVKENDAVLIPPGIVHSTENTGNEDLSFVAAFSSRLPSTYAASGADVAYNNVARYSSRVYRVIRSARRFMRKLLR